MAVLLALAAAVGWGSSGYAAGRSSRTTSAMSLVVLTHLASLIALVVIATVPGQTGSPDVADLVWGLAAGLGGGAGALLLFSGLAKGSMSVVAPITALGAALVAVTAGVLQDESLGVLGGLGVALALAAMVMVSFGGTDEQPSTVELPTVELPADEIASHEPDDDPEGESPDERTELHEAPTLAVEPDPAGRSQAADDALIEAYEREFIITSPADEPVPAVAPVAEATSETVDEATPPPDPIEVARSFNELAAAVHSRRDAFEVTRLSQIRPAVDRPIPEDFFGKADSRRQRSKNRRASRPEKPVRTKPTRTKPVRTTARPDFGSVIGSKLRRPGMAEALLSGLGFGLFFVVITRASESAGYWPLVSARLISVVMFAAAAIIATNAVMPDRRSRPGVVLAGLLDAGAAVLFVLATRDGLLSTGAVLASMSPVIVVLLARFVGDERVTRQQVSGLALAGLAIGLLAI